MSKTDKVPVVPSSEHNPQNFKKFFFANQIIDANEKIRQKQSLRDLVNHLPDENLTFLRLLIHEEEMHRTGADLLGIELEPR